jgi:hypothetical protein
LIKIYLFLILLVPLFVLAAPAQVQGSASASVFVVGSDGITKPMELKDEDFQLGKDNVVSTPLNGKISIFADVGVEFTEAKLTPAANPQSFEVPIVGGQISFDGMYSGVYTLDVIVGNNAYQCIVVVGERAQQQNAITNQITQNNHNDNDLEDQQNLDKDKEQICRFTPQNEICAPDPETGQCDEGFNLNEDGQCFTSGPCPDEYHRANDDETGACVSEDDLEKCNDGSWKYPEDDCYGEDPSPIPPIEDEIAEIEEQQKEEQKEEQGNSTDSDNG